MNINNQWNNTTTNGANVTYSWKFSEKVENRIMRANRHMVLTGYVIWAIYCGLLVLAGYLFLENQVAAGIGLSLLLVFLGIINTTARTLITSLTADKKAMRDIAEMMQKNL